MLCYAMRCKGRMRKTYNDKQLHTQLLYFKSLFDAKAARAAAAESMKQQGKEEDPVDTLGNGEDAALCKELTQQVLASSRAALS